VVVVVAALAYRPARIGYEVGQAVVAAASAVAAAASPATSAAEFSLLAALEGAAVRLRGALILIILGRFILRIGLGSVRGYLHGRCCVGASFR